MFQEVLRQLCIRHNRSTAYHPESQGDLERFHQTLKSLLTAYCTELKGDWEEGLPWLLLAAREVVQESLGFSPNQLVFGHCVRGPLGVLCGPVQRNTRSRGIGNVSSKLHTYPGLVSVSPGCSIFNIN